MDRKKLTITLLPALFIGSSAFTGIVIANTPMAIVALPFYYLLAWFFGKAREIQGEIKGLIQAKQDLQEIEDKLKEIVKQIEEVGAG